MITIMKKLSGGSSLHRHMHHQKPSAAHWCSCLRYLHFTSLLDGNNTHKWMNMILEENGLVAFLGNKTVYQKLTLETAGLGTGLLISLLPVPTLQFKNVR